MKNRLFVSGITLLVVGAITLVLGIIVFLEVQGAQERLELMIKAGSSVPFVTYDLAWKYFETSAIFFGIGGFLLVWRKRK